MQLFYEYMNEIAVRCCRGHLVASAAPGEMDSCGVTDLHSVGGGRGGGWGLFFSMCRGMASTHQ